MSKLVNGLVSALVVGILSGLIAVTPYVLFAVLGGQVTGNVTAWLYEHFFSCSSCR